MFFGCCLLSKKNWMSGKKMRNLSYKKVDEHKWWVLFFIFSLHFGRKKKKKWKKNALCTLLLLYVLIMLSLFLGCKKTKESWTEYSVCPGDWQNPPLNPRVSCCYRQTAISLHCRQSWCRTSASGSTGKLYTGWDDVLTSFLRQPQSIWLSLSLMLLRGICNTISLKVQVNFRLDYFEKVNLIL